MNRDLRQLSRFPRISLSVLPTPLQKLERLSRDLGCTIYCKRDDLTGFAFGGNKTRKLDYLIADAIGQGADTLIATGALQSNFCRMAAAAGRTYNLDVHLVLGTKNLPEHPTANYLLDQLFGATIHTVPSDDWIILEEHARQLSEKFTSQGRKPYTLPVGGSTPVGALGYVEAFVETMNDCHRMGITPDTIIHASSSAGTQAGLVVGKELAGWKGRLIGMGVAKDHDTLVNDVYTLACSTGSAIGISPSRDAVIIDHRAIGPGYGVKTPECEEAIRLFAEREGILLDTVYTGKAAAGMISSIRDGSITQDETVIFIHTGGNIELFA